MANEKVAKICHQVNKAICELQGDLSQVDWDKTSNEIKQSASVCQKNYACLKRHKDTICKIVFSIDDNIFKDYHSDEYIRKLLTLFSTDTIKRKEQYYYDLQVLIKKSKNKNHIKIYSDLLKENN